MRLFIFLFFPGPTSALISIVAFLMIWSLWLIVSFCSGAFGGFGTTTTSASAGPTFSFSNPASTGDDSLCFVVHCCLATFRWHCVFKTSCTVCCYVVLVPGGGLFGNTQNKGFGFSSGLGTGTGTGTGFGSGLGGGGLGFGGFNLQSTQPQQGKNRERVCEHQYRGDSN